MDSTDITSNKENVELNCTHQSMSNKISPLNVEENRICSNIEITNIKTEDSSTIIKMEATDTSSKESTELDLVKESMSDKMLSLNDESRICSSIEISNIKIEDTSTIDSGFDENSQDSTLITPAMLEEERKLQEQIQKDQEKERREYEKKRREIEKKEHEKTMKEIRYKRLMNLLEKSQFYAKFMSNKVSKYLAEEKEKDKKPKKNSKRKRNGIVEEYSENIMSAASKKLKTENNTSIIVDQNTSAKNIAEPNIKHINYKKNDSKDDEKRMTSLGIEVSVRQPLLLEGAALRDYQLDGLSWLKILFESGMNGILADEMGLGKTVQVISLICHLYENGVTGPFLIVGPLSTLPNWLLEFGKFAPQLPVVLYHGNESERIALRKQLRLTTRLLSFKVLPVVLTSYEIPIRDESTLSKFHWKYIIVDEGHRLKNYKTQLARKLSAFNSVNRLLLTGTPLQNNLTELWSLLHFLIPDIFDSLDVFQSWFEVEDIERSDVATALVEQEKKDKILSVLHQILAPFLLRRVKADVNLNLPPKKEVLVYCPLSQIQRKLYEAILDRSILKSWLGKEEESLIIEDNPDGTKVKRRSALRKEAPVSFIQKEKPDINEPIVIDYGIDQYILEVKIQNPSMALRKTVNHPYLINMPVLPGSKILRIDEGLVTDCGKTVVLDGLLKKLKERNHKVILFSTFTSLLDLLEEYVLMRGYDYERLDGRHSLESRKKSIYRFNTDENVFIFLISTRAGGLGINLTSADTAIIYDSDWNPQADLQAQDRCHRIGQTRPVVVYRFISEGTLDERIYSRATAKRKLEKIVIQRGKFNKTMGQSNNSDAMDLEMLRELLNSKPESKELRTDGTVMSDEEWEKLLDRSDLIAEMNKNMDVNK